MGWKDRFFALGCVCGQLFSRVQLLRPPWTVVCQVPLSMGFPKEEYWWFAISFSRGSSWPKDRTCASCICRQIVYHWAPWGVHVNYRAFQKLCSSKLKLASSVLLPQNSLLCRFRSGGWERAWILRDLEKTKSSNSFHRKRTETRAVEPSSSSVSWELSSVEADFEYCI